MFNRYRRTSTADHTFYFTHKPKTIIPKPHYNILRESVARKCKFRSKFEAYKLNSSIEANKRSSFPLSFITRENERVGARSPADHVTPRVLMSTHLMTSQRHPRWPLIGDIQINNHSGGQRCVSGVLEDYLRGSVTRPTPTRNQFSFSLMQS